MSTDSKVRDTLKHSNKNSGSERVNLRSGSIFILLFTYNSGRKIETKILHVHQLTRQYTGGKMAVCSGLTNRKSSSQIFRKVSSFFAKPSMGIWWVLSPNKQNMYNCHLSLRPSSHTMLLTTYSNHRFMRGDFFTLVSLYIFPCQFFTGVQLSECLE